MALYSGLYSCYCVRGNSHTEPPVFSQSTPKGEFHKIRILHPEHALCLWTTAIFSVRITIYVEAYPILSQTFLSTPCCLCYSVGTTLLLCCYFPCLRSYFEAPPLTHIHSLHCSATFSPNMQWDTFLLQSYSEMFRHIERMHAGGCERQEMNNSQRTND